jgi:hypothetical protein
MTWPSASSGGYDPNVDPGNVNPPAIFEPSTAIIPGSAPQIWIAASGGPNWGGCLVSISFDGTNYDYIGTISAPAYQGVLSAGLATASGLDTTNTLAIDLTESAGVFPTSATNADATALRTLCYVCPAFGSALLTGNISGTSLGVSSLVSGTIAIGDSLFGPGLAAGTIIESGSGSSWTVNTSQTVSSTSMAAMGATATCPNTGELLAYGAVAATLPGPYTSDLTYLERGAYGTTGNSHATGDFFSRIDLGELNTPPNSVIAYTLPTQYIGATLYLKLQSFNVFGNETQDISTVTEYIYTPSGSGYGGGGSGTPTTPTGLTAFPIHGFISLQWSANPSSDHVTNYNVLRAASSGGPYSAIGSPTNNSYNDNTVVSGTTYYYEIQAINAAGASAASSPIAATAS